MRTANPILNDRTFEDMTWNGPEGALSSPSSTMTIQGTATKTLGLLGLVILAGAWTWYLFINSVVQTANGPQYDVGAVMPWIIGGVIGGLILGVITAFKHDWAPVTAPLYAVFEGLFLGGISAMMETMYPGIVIQAVGLTVGTLLVMLLAFKTGLIKVSEKFKLGVLAATGAVALFYLGTMIARLMGAPVEFFYGSGLLSIGISGVIVVIAALNLVLDFDFIAKGAEAGAPKHMEWYGAFGLLVTLVWLYIEILRLLAKLRER